MALECAADIWPVPCGQKVQQIGHFNEPNGSPRSRQLNVNTVIGGLEDFAKKSAPAHNSSLHN